MSKELELIDLLEKEWLADDSDEDGIASFDSGTIETVHIMDKRKGNGFSITLERIENGILVYINGKKYHIEHLWDLPNLIEEHWKE